MGDNDTIDNDAVDTDEVKEDKVKEVKEDKVKEDKEGKPKKVEELCLAGAANRGIAYIGALQALHEHNILDLKKFIGVSIGSLVGIGYIIGYDMGELMEDVLKQDISEFQDISIDSAMNNGSVLRGEKYRIWVWDLLSKKIDPMTNFQTLYEKFGVDITVAVVSLDSGKDGLEYFSLSNSPKMPIYYAIMATMAIPLVFPPVVYNGKRYIDGGILENFPLGLLSEHAIGFKITSKQVEADITNLSYLSKLLQLVGHRLGSMRSYEGTALVIDASDFSTINFNLNVDHKITLYYRGYDKSLEFIDQFVDVFEESSS